MSQNLQEPLNLNANTPANAGDGGMSGDNLLCTNCGSFNPAHARFCTICGQPLQMSSMEFGQDESFPPYNAAPDPDLEALPTTPLPLPSAEEATPPVIEKTNTIPLVSSPPANGWRHRIKSRRFATIALIVLILLLLGSSLPFLIPYLHTHLPASGATVTIIPSSKDYNNTYSMSAVTRAPDASQHQVGARLLSYTAPAKSVTVRATGQSTEGVTEATGTLIFSNASGNFIIFNQTFADSSGVGLTIDNSFTIYAGQTLAIPAHAARAGTIGNVPIDDINATLSVGQFPTSIGTIHVENTSPFSGGTDQTITVVQQSDIDAAASGLQSQLTSDAQAVVQSKVQTNEQLTSDLQCNPRVTSNHQANDKASNVTVTVSVTCQGEVYDLQAAQAMAADMLKSDAATQFGGNYALAGNIITQTPAVTSTDQDGTVWLAVTAQGRWVFQFSDSHKQNLARLIAGKTQVDALALLLKQPGIIKVGISPSGGLGTALPSAENIKWVVVNLPGL